MQEEGDEEGEERRRRRCVWSGVGGMRMEGGGRGG